MTKEQFFNYHANRGGKLLAYWLGNDYHNDSFKTWAALTIPFELASNGKRYKFKNDTVILA